MDDDTEDWFSETTATFGDRLAGAREAVGLSQKDLAAKLGVRLKTLRQWEDDISEPRSNRLSMLAGMLNVSILWLLSGKGDGPAAPGHVPPEADVLALLDEMKSIRREMKGLGGRLSALEKRLRARWGA